LGDSAGVWEGEKIRVRPSWAIPAPRQKLENRGTNQKMGKTILAERPSFYTRGWSATDSAQQRKLSERYERVLCLMARIVFSRWCRKGGKKGFPLCSNFKGD